MDAFFSLKSEYSYNLEMKEAKFGGLIEGGGRFGQMSRFRLFGLRRGSALWFVQFVDLGEPFVIAVTGTVREYSPGPKIFRLVL
jgi:hypothetical protein